MDAHITAYYAWSHKRFYLILGYTEAYAEQERRAYLAELLGGARKTQNTHDRIRH